MDSRRNRHFDTVPLTRSSVGWDLSTLTGPAMPHTASPTSPTRSKPSYDPISNDEDDDEDESRRNSIQQDIDISDASRREPVEDADADGLGIRRARVVSIVSIPPRYSVSSATGPQTSRSSDPLLSPTFQRRSSGVTIGEVTPPTPAWETPQSPSRGYTNDERNGRRQSSLHSVENSIAETPEEYLPKASSTTLRAAYDDGSGPDLPFKCSSRRNIYKRRRNWLSVTLLILSIYSTLMSGLYLFVAIVKPRFGRAIHTSGSLTPSTASLISALFAKTIELSFVTVFVAFLGQVLSRRAIKKDSRGITVAEMTMRNWVMQPGTLLTHWAGARYASLTFLGMVSLTATLDAMFYTTAADALVAPVLKFGSWENKPMSGLVQTEFANTDFVAKNCQTPMTDNNAADPTSDQDLYDNCLSIEYAGESFHNFQGFMTTWANIYNTGNGSTQLSSRPNGAAMLYDNTTVQASWVDVVNITEQSLNHSRLINNVTIAFPHPGVSTAARDPKNNILQPADLNGLGEYRLNASVISSALNVMCVGMNATELAPLVYQSWDPDAVDVAQDWPSIAAGIDSVNSTVVDDLFGFGTARQAPIFPLLPEAYNTILNISVPDAVSDSIYLLGAAGTPSDLPPYVLCGMRALFYPNCSTRYSASSVGGALEAHCDDPNDRYSYRRSVPDAPSPAALIQRYWKDIGSLWGTSVSLNDGITSGNASIARALTSFIPTDSTGTNAFTLSPILPSIAEALAVLAGSTLLLSAQDSPFDHFWPYDVPSLQDAQYETFNATLQSQEYASGGAQPWQGIFYVVLVLTFLTNILCLVAMIFHSGRLTDFTEPQNLFSLAINSSPSQRLAGSCGAGPEKGNFQVPWFIEKDDDDHIYIRSNEDPLVGKSTAIQLEPETSPLSAAYSRLSTPRTPGSRRSILELL